MTKAELTKILATIHDTAREAGGAAADAERLSLRAKEQGDAADDRVTEARSALKAAAVEAWEASSAAEDAHALAYEANLRCGEIEESLSDLLHILRESGIAIEEAA